MRLHGSRGDDPIRFVYEKCTMSLNRLLSRLLFVLVLSLAVGLGGLLLLAPVIVPVSESDPGPRWLQLFAHDATLRRTTLASAIGLVVTACIFFRTPRETTATQA